MPVSQILAYLISGVLSITLGYFAFRQDPKDKANSSFFIFTIGQLFWITSLFLAYNYAYQSPPNLDRSIIFFRLAYGFGILMVPLLIRFLYHFPRQAFKPSRVLVALFYVSALFIFVVSAFTPLMHESQFLLENGTYDDTDVFGPMYPFYSLLTLVYFFTAAVVAFIKLRRLTGIEKSKMFIAAVGCWGFLFMAFLINVLLPILGFWKVGIGPLTVQKMVHHSTIFTLIFVIPSFYSILRYRFFNVTNRAFNVFRELLLVSLYLFAVFFFYVFLLQFLNYQGVTLVLLSGFIGLLVFQLVQYLVPELLTSRFLDFRNTIADLTSSIYYAETFEKLSSLLEKYFVIQLNVKSAKLYVIRKRGKKVNLPVFYQGDFTKFVSKYKKEVLVADELPFQRLAKKKKETALKAMAKLDASLCFPLRSDKNLIGFFVLGHKGDQEGYTTDELKELLQFKKYLEISFMNVLLQKNLQEENNVMKAVIQEKTRLLKAQYGRIKELVGQQSDFIAATAHEFRTPLSVAVFQLADINKNATKLPPKELKAQLKDLDLSLQNIRALTQKMYDVQKYDLNKVEVNMETISIKSFVQSFSAGYKLHMAQKKIEFKLINKLPKALKMKIDKAQMNQVFTNLLTNAYKFTPEKGTIQLEAIPKGRSSIQIRISDSGAGVPEEMKTALFDKFRTNKQKGSGLGLGLYICKKIVELHRGKIWIEDSPLGGAVFIIELKK